MSNLLMIFSFINLAMATLAFVLVCAHQKKSHIMIRTVIADYHASILNIEHDVRVAFQRIEDLRLTKLDKITISEFN